MLDITNGTIIGTSAVFSHIGAKAIVGIGVISNLPIGEAIFEVNIRRVAGVGGSVILYSAQLYS